MLFLSLALVFLLPPFIHVALGTSSLALGLLIASVLLILLHIKSLRNLDISTRFIKVSLFFWILLALSALYSSISYDSTKPIFSLVLFLPFLASLGFAKTLSQHSFKEVLSSIENSIVLLLLLGVIALVYTPDYFDYRLYQKPVFPFSEESHYALSLGLLSLGYAFVSPLRNLLLLGTVMGLLAMLFPNLTLLLFAILVFLSATLRLKPIYFKRLLWLLPFFFAMLFFLFSQVEYFASRLHFTNSQNITTLVFLQGWDFAYMNVIHTFGLGLGFQMLGSPLSILSEYSHTIYTLTGNKLNFYDGSFLASKVISEFGLFGILSLLAYLLFLLKIVFESNRLNAHKKELNTQKKLLLYGIIFAFVIEVFLRGYGYFSSGLFLFATAFFMLYTVNTSKKES